MRLAEVVRRVDPDRYLCALFAPAARREALFVLYAFNHEIARACEVTRDPALSLIRLQWWREVVEGQARAHEVAGAVKAAVADGALDGGALLEMIAAREREAEGCSRSSPARRPAGMIAAREREAEGDFESLAAWRGWLLQGAGSVMVAAGRALGAPVAVEPRLREMGAGFGAAGQLRNARVAGRRLVPPDEASAAGAGRALLGAELRCGRSWVAAALPAVLARRDLARAPRESRGITDRLAVVTASLTCIV